MCQYPNEHIAHDECYNDVINCRLRKETATPMALFPTNHALSQGSLHYRLATLGYQKRNTYGVEIFIL